MAGTNAVSVTTSSASALQVATAFARSSVMDFAFGVPGLEP
jgi:hypothetical protein